MEDLYKQSFSFENLQYPGTFQDVFSHYNTRGSSERLSDLSSSNAKFPARVTLHVPCDPSNDLNSKASAQMEPISKNLGVQTPKMTNLKSSMIKAFNKQPLGYKHWTMDKAMQLYGVRTRQELKDMYSLGQWLDRLGATDDEKCTILASKRLKCSDAAAN